jgi:hypothetical protein
MMVLLSVCLPSGYRREACALAAGIDPAAAAAAGANAGSSVLQLAALAEAQRRPHDPSQLSLYQHSSNGPSSGASGPSSEAASAASVLEVRLTRCEEWRAEQAPRAPFRTCYQLWGLACAGVTSRW